jgi:hypothetical protein
MSSYRVKQAITMYRLVGLGYRQINSYSDGVVLVENAYGVRTFVRPDGTITQPHTTITRDAESVIRQADIEVAR